MSEEALISCLCVTRNRVRLLTRAVSCFLKQTYQPRELILVYQADDADTRDYAASLSESSIRSVVVPCSPQLSLGALRNLSIQASQGRYVAQWDDDDWYAPTRLAKQIGAIRATGRSGCVLARWVLYDELTQKAYMSIRRTWEGSLVAERAAVPPYSELAKGEDTPVIARLLAEKKLICLDRPDLYIYIYHGGNTWQREHWEKLLASAVPVRQEDTDRVRALLAADGGS